MYFRERSLLTESEQINTDRNGGIKSVRKFPQKVMVWLGCTEDATPLVILNEGTVDYETYIKKVRKKCYW